MTDLKGASPIMGAPTLGVNKPSAHMVLAHVVAEKGDGATADELARDIMSTLDAHGYEIVEKHA